MKNYETHLECWKCLRCDYLWVKRPGNKPIACPGCTSIWWDRPLTVKPGRGRKKKAQSEMSSRAIPREVEKNNPEIDGSCQSLATNAEQDTQTASVIPTD